VTFAPAIRPQLLDLIEALDDDTRGIASIWRELGHVARSLGLIQPSYESVRRIVHVQRAVRRLTYSQARSVAILAAEFLWNTRNRKGIVLDIIDGADLERRPERYGRRARGPTPRADA
jgi:hypothetical protein